MSAIVRRRFRRHIFGSVLVVALGAFGCESKTVNSLEMSMVLPAGMWTNISKSIGRLEVWLIGTSGSLFSASTDLSQGSTPEGLTFQRQVADIDGDGKLDFWFTFPSNPFGNTRSKTVTLLSRSVNSSFKVRAVAFHQSTNAVLATAEATTDVAGNSLRFSGKSLVTLQFECVPFLNCPVPTDGGTVELDAGPEEGTITVNWVLPTADAGAIGIDPAVRATLGPVELYFDETSTTGLFSSSSQSISARTYDGIPFTYQIADVDLDGRLEYSVRIPTNPFVNLTTWPMVFTGTSAIAPFIVKGRLLTNDGGTVVAQAVATADTNAQLIQFSSTARVVNLNFVCLSASVCTTPTTPTSDAAVTPPDTTAPETTIDGGVFISGTSNAATQTFVVSCSEPGCSVQCDLNDGGYAACGLVGGTYTTPTLTDGVYVFRARGIDFVGNIDPTPATVTWTNDRTAPNTTIDAGSVASGYSNTATPSFGIACNEASCTFECALNDGGYAACGSTYTASVPSDGVYVLYARATDIPGNVDSTPASVSWVNDMTRPTSTITSVSGAALDDPDSGRAWIPYGTTYSAVGTAVDNLTGISYVAVSGNGGSSWQPISGAETWSGGAFTAQSFTPERLLSRANDIVGNVETPDGGRLVYTTFWPASLVIGQPDAGGFDQTCKNAGGAYGLNRPLDVAYDPDGGLLFIADSFNNRVLVHQVQKSPFGFIDNKADYVLGQPDFAHCQPAVSVTGMNNPIALAFDDTRRRLFVSDQYNHRILVFDLNNLSNGLAASTVIGQTSFTSNAAGLTATTLNYPWGLALDVAGDRLLAADWANNRVLIFTTGTLSNGMAASVVLGQSGFTTNTSGLSAATFNRPLGVSYDPGGQRLFVADSYNHRVLVFNAGPGVQSGASAANVLGQTDFVSNDAGGTPGRLRTPAGVAFAPTDGGRLFVSDFDNLKIKVFDVATIDAGETEANYLGPGYILTRANTFYGAYGLTFLRSPAGEERLFVADTSHQRVLMFNVNTIVNEQNATWVLGQFDGGADGGNVDYTKDCVNDPSAIGLNLSSGAYLAIDSVRRRLFVSDTNNNRVLVFNLDTLNRPLDTVADYVLGQAAFDRCAPPNNPSQAIMNQPYGLALDADGGRLFVGDYAHRRVLVFDVNTITNGQNATNVIGQTDFTSSVSATTASNFKSFRGLAYDERTQRLFVADAPYNNRVVVFNVSTITNGMDASIVLGQPDFTSANVPTSPAANSFGEPLDVALHPDAGLLFVSDFAYHRVLVFNTNALTNGAVAINVIGQDRFDAGGSQISQKGLFSPSGIQVDPQRNLLYVSDGRNYRIMVFDIATLANGLSAVNVIGQASFVSSDAGISSQMLNPGFLALDSTGARLYAASVNVSGPIFDNRVLLFDLTP